jgi:hypothetical protein
MVIFRDVFAFRGQRKRVSGPMDGGQQITPQDSQGRFISLAEDLLNAMRLCGK